jgi:hypothetical protein
MKICIYCRKEKDESEFSLEHVIPQFLGGSQSPDKLKTRDVCKCCNNNLGLFVDASFEKDFLVFNNLNAAAQAFFDPESPSSLPLHCLGVSDFRLSNIEETEVCEYWIGPLGEQVFWIRPNDSRMYWYSGGNPRSVKKLKSRAYFMFSERSLKNPIISWLCFRDAFKGKSVKKIMCTAVSGENPETIGFSEPDSIDQERISFLSQIASNGKEQKNKLSMNASYDQRFLAKLAIGVSHCLFGNSIKSSSYMDELFKALWFRDGDPIPKVLGSSALTEGNEAAKEFFGIEHGVTITVLRVSESIVINLNIGKKLNWSIKCAKVEDLTSQDMDILGEEGLCIILYKSLGKGFEMSFADFLAHKTGDISNSQIASVELLINKQSNYFADL